MKMKSGFQLRAVFTSREFIIFAPMFRMKPSGARNRVTSRSENVSISHSLRIAPAARRMSIPVRPLPQWRTRKLPTKSIRCFFTADIIPYFPFH